MTPFLQQVADHYFSTSVVEETVFVFPNRRSIAFFKKYLAENVADPTRNASAPGHGGQVRPVKMPQMLTMNDFFYRVAGLEPADRVSLLIDLYYCYKALNPKAEPLDEFIFWGDVILGDFNDVDKYLADPERLFTNISDFKDIQDTFSYLTEDQRKAIEAFVRHFKENGKLKVNLSSDDPDIKARFLLIWNILYPLYQSFGKALKEKGTAYEGMVYRALAEDDSPVVDLMSDKFRGCSKFVFVGLNALNECEKKVMKKMQKAGIAEFCWDYSSDMIKNHDNKASMFMADNAARFAQVWKLEEDGLASPEINVISVPSSVGQAKQLPGIFRQIASQNADGDLSMVGKLVGKGTDCAVVLPDESMLQPVLNSIPPEIESINVTMGYPMSGSTFYSLMTDIALMQLHLRNRKEGQYFYYKNVWSIFSNPVFRKAADEKDEQIIKKIKADAKYYIPRSDLSGSELFDSVFIPVVENVGDTDPGQIRGFCRYQASVIEAIAPKIRNDVDIAPELEFARRYHAAVNRLSAMDLAIQPATYVRLLAQLTGTETVPYEGEPLKGLQVMGPLETRALDFSNLVVLSCNEGMFPRRSVASSFIPPELRKGFGLPTYEHQDAVWAYYFYRMIQRASRVWLLFDSRTENAHSGEESRYIKQLEYHFRLKVNRFVAKSVPQTETSDMPVTKPTDMAERMKDIVFSASSLENYLECPAKFYYATIEGLSAEDGEVTETLDAKTLGNVFHATMQALYLGGKAMDPSFSMSRENVSSAIEDGSLLPLKRISKDYLKSILGDGNAVKSRIRSCIQEELRTVEVTGRNLIIEDVIYNYVLKAVQRDLEKLESLGTDGFDVLGLELKCWWKLDGYRFKGYIDRLDSFTPDTIRVVDYKTGKVTDNEVMIDSSNAADIAQKLFTPDIADKPKIAFQLFLYDMFLENIPAAKGKIVHNSIYQVSRLFSKGFYESEKCEVFCSHVKEGLQELLAEIADPDIPFNRTSNPDICKWCDFKTICGK